MLDDRADTALLAATENATVPFPCPLVPAVSEIHDAAPADADHVQSRSVVTVTPPVPPEAPKLDGEPDRVTWQRAGVGPVIEVLVDPQAAAVRAATARATARTARSRRAGRGSQLASFRDEGTPEAQQATRQRG